MLTYIILRDSHNAPYDEYHPQMINLVSCATKVSDGLLLVLKTQRACILDCPTHNTHDKWYWFIKSCDFKNLHYTTTREILVVQIMACRLFGAKPLSKLQWNFNQNTKFFIDENASENSRLPKWRPFCPGGDELRHAYTWFYPIKNNGCNHLP